MASPRGLSSVYSLYLFKACDSVNHPFTSLVAGSFLSACSCLFCYVFFLCSVNRGILPVLPHQAYFPVSLFFLPFTRTLVAALIGFNVRTLEFQTQGLRFIPLTPGFLTSPCSKVRGWFRAVILTLAAH